MWTRFFFVLEGGGGGWPHLPGDVTHSSLFLAAGLVGGARAAPIGMWGGEGIPEVPSSSRRGSEATGGGRRGGVDSASKGSTRFLWKPVAPRRSGAKVWCFLSGFFLPPSVLFVRFLLFRNLEFWQTDCLSYFFQPRPPLLPPQKYSKHADHCSDGSGFTPHLQRKVQMGIPPTVWTSEPGLYL